MTGRVTVEVGRFHCGTVREYLKRESFLHPTIRFHESAGTFERTFTITGNLADIRRIHAQLVVWAEQNEAAS